MADWRHEATRIRISLKEAALARTPYPGIVRLKFEGEAITNSYFILVAQIRRLLENQRTALPIQL
jgi:hypothetical protein